MAGVVRWIPPRAVVVRVLLNVVVPLPAVCVKEPTATVELAFTSCADVKVKEVGGVIPPIAPSKIRLPAPAIKMALCAPSTVL
jgi:hypothetical protein